MAITFVGAGAQAAAATADVVAAFPAAYTAVAGDLGIIAVVGKSGVTGINPAAPAGWTLRSNAERNLGARFLRIATYWRVLQAGDTAPTVLIPSDWNAAANGISAQMLVYRGVDTSTPFDVADNAQSGATATTWTPGGLTTVTDHAWCVATVGSADDNQLSLSTPAGFSDRMSGASYSVTVGGKFAVAAADLDVTPLGAVSMPTWTETQLGTDQWVGVVMALRPAVTGFTPGITVISVGALAASNTGNLTPAWPVGYTPIAGHYALLFVAGWSTDAGGTYPSAPAGWTLVSQGGSTGPPFVVNEIFQRFLQAGDSAPTVVLPADWINVAGGGSAHIEVYAGVDTATPEDVGHISGGLVSGTTGTPAPRTSVTDHALHIVFMVSGDDNALSLSTPNGFTDRASGASYQTTLGADHATAVADLDKSPAGLPTAPIFTQTANGPDLWAFIALALRPARAQVSGTVTIAITEADVVAGSKTIIITLGGGLQWIPA